MFLELHSIFQTLAYFGTHEMSHIFMPMNAVNDLTLILSINLTLTMWQAHQHAANAEDHLGNGLLIPALEEHSKAAEAYLAAVERSHDESVLPFAILGLTNIDQVHFQAKRTLRLLYNEHCKAGKDLQRRIDKMKEEGKDPALPQKLERPQSSTTRSNSHTHLGIPRSAPSPPPQRPMYDSHNMVDESFMLLAGQRVGPVHLLSLLRLMQGTAEVRPR